MLRFFIKNNKYVFTILLIFIFLTVLVTNLIFYYLQSVNFNFIDEFDNIMAGFYMTKGRLLFSEIVHHRQPGMVWISFLLQKLTIPGSLYELIVVHRYFIMFFSIIATLFISFRFGLTGFLAIVVYEVIAYYSHGNLFQGESISSYILVYLFGLFLYTLKEKKVYKIDILLSAFFTFAVCIVRETLIPVALFLYASIFWKQQSKEKFVSLSIFLILLILTVISLPLKDYYYQLVQLNFAQVISSELTVHGGKLVSLLKSFMYPIWTIINFRAEEYNAFLVLLSLVFLGISSYIYKTLYTLRPLIFLISIVLFLSVLRPIDPKAFYAAYKIGPWSALLSLAVFFLLFEIILKNKLYIKLLLSFSIGIFLLVFSINRFIIQSQKSDRVFQFNTNYNRYFVTGKVVQILSDKNDTFFIDGYDSLMYWQADTKPAFEYIFFYPVMINDPFFSKKRNKMFLKTPPTFYYRDCFDKKNYILPVQTALQYIELKNNKKSSCLYMLKSKKETISLKKIEEIGKLQYTLY